MAEKKLKFWFDEVLAKMLAQKIAEHYPAFDSKNFVSSIAEAVEPLELKARLAVFAEKLHKYLPEDYREAIPIIAQCLGPENPNETGMFTVFYWVMPFASFVEKYGLEHPELSLRAIGEITCRNTGEFAVRPYLEAHPDTTFAQMLQWSRSKNFHLRRLASEGTRARLPWAKKLDCVIAEPSLTRAILENLKDDPCKFVQKSVANHINDMFKDNYAAAIEIVKRWQKAATKERKWNIRHALRQELKKNNPEAQEVIASL